MLAHTRLMSDLMKIASTIHCFHERIQMKHLFYHVLLEEESLTVVLDVSMLDVSEQEKHWKVDGRVDGKQLLEGCCIAAAAWIVQHRCIVVFCCRFFPSFFSLT